MTASDRIVEQLLGNLEEAGSGIFVKHLRNGPLYTCRCPCGTFHGGFRDLAQARANLKCRRCYRSEIEKLKKEVEKVDKPKPQKNIFQNPLNKRSVIGEALDDEDFDIKDVLSQPESEYIAYEIYDGREYFPVLNTGKIGRQGAASPKAFSGQWLFVGLIFDRRQNTFTRWATIKPRLDAGETLRGYVYDFDNGGHRVWGQKASIRAIKSVNESDDEDDFDIKDVGGTRFEFKPGDIVRQPGSHHSDRLGTLSHIGGSAYDDPADLVWWVDYGNGPNQLEFKLASSLELVRRYPTLRDVNESDDEDEDVKSVLGYDYTDNKPYAVTKAACVQAHYGQEFYSRLEFDRSGFPKRVRTSGKCKTWSTRPNEFRLPVKFGFYQSLYITHDNAGDFSTVPLSRDGKPL